MKNTESCCNNFVRGNKFFQSLWHVFKKIWGNNVIAFTIFLKLPAVIDFYTKMLGFLFPATPEANVPASSDPRITHSVSAVQQSPVSRVAADAITFGSDDAISWLSAEPQSCDVILPRFPFSGQGAAIAPHKPYSHSGHARCHAHEARRHGAARL